MSYKSTERVQSLSANQTTFVLFLRDVFLANMPESMTCTDQCCKAREVTFPNQGTREDPTDTRPTIPKRKALLQIRTSKWQKATATQEQGSEFNLHAIL